MRLLKIVIAFCTALLLLELGLQAWAKTTSKYNSFQHFLAQLDVWPEDFSPENTIIMVGDSTVYGVGASDHSKFSFPTRLQELLKTVSSSIKVVNLGYPATNSEEHLQLLHKIPDNSFVILRSGCSNLWNSRGGGFVFQIAGFFIELRILRMLSMLFPAAQTEISLRNRELRAFQAFEELAQRKNLRLYYFDYAYSHPHFQGLFSQHERFIPNFTVLQKAGLIHDNEPDKLFINPDKHPTDAGYELEAIIIFNYLCQHQLYNLQKNQVLPLAVGKSFIAELEKNYRQIRQDLKNSEVLWLTNPKEIRNLYALLSQIIRLLPQHEQYQQQQYQQELADIEKILVFAYHDIELIVDKLYMLMDRSGEFMRNDLSGQEILNARRYYRLLCGFINIGQGTPKEIHLNLLERMKNGFRPILEADDLNFPRFVPLITQPFPLEFCPTYVGQSGFSLPELALQKEWHNLFGVTYSVNLFGQIPLICQKK